jgi:hypothetical protein
MFILCNFSRSEGKVIQGRLVSGFGKGREYKWLGDKDTLVDEGRR